MGEMVKRSHMCGELTLDQVGKEVSLNGWVQRNRNMGGLIFCDLRDKTGVVQIIFDQTVSEETFKLAETLKSEYVIGLIGEVRERSAKNSDMKTGDIEILATCLVVYSEAETPPIYIKDGDTVSETNRLKYRYLDLRKLEMQKKLTMRHKITRCIRNFYDEAGFTEVETPTLIKPTPEGARDYVVPSRVNLHSFYALPQSPQMFKQLLMVAGTDKYYQITKCFRDEDLRADRQPEFTQVDVEMSFVEMEDILSINENMMKKVMKDILGTDIQTPFPRLSYDEAMDRFGSDKPDLRFGFELKTLDHVFKNSEFQVFSNALNSGGTIRAINLNGYSKSFSRKDLDKMQKSIETFGAKGLIWVRFEATGIASSISKFLNETDIQGIKETVLAKEGDLVLIVADEYDVTSDALGFLRRQAAETLGLLDSNEYNFLWVVDFPLMEYNKEDGRYYSKHHPFTSPKEEDIPLLKTDLGKVKAKAYDMVLNGCELGGGSIRIHDSKLQETMFAVLGLSKEEIETKFGFFVQAFKYGTPPHGGIAFGLDRMVMLLLGEDNIREVIAFPKTQAAVCLMSQAPALVSNEQLDELGIALKE